MKKRLISMIIALAMVFTLVPVTPAIIVKAATETQTLIAPLTPSPIPQTDFVIENGVLVKYTGAAIMYP